MCIQTAQLRAFPFTRFPASILYIQTNENQHSTLSSVMSASISIEPLIPKVLFIYFFNVGIFIQLQKVAQRLFALRSKSNKCFIQKFLFAFKWMEYLSVEIRVSIKHLFDVLQSLRTFIRMEMLIKPCEHLYPSIRCADSQYLLSRNVIYNYPQITECQSIKFNCTKINNKLKSLLESVKLTGSSRCVQHPIKNLCTIVTISSRTKSRCPISV